MNADISVLAKEDIFKLIGSEWMLVTAGNKEDFNTMTASWGGFGWLWNKPVAFIFIRPERYTHDFIEKEGRFTLSFFDEKYREALQICGSKSGRDCDKVGESGLEAVTTKSGGITFSQARMTLDCRKLFRTEMEDASFIDRTILEKWYNGSHGGLHTVYIAEIESVIVHEG